MLRTQLQPFRELRRYGAREHEKPRYNYRTEVHYEFKPEQDESIKHFLAERGLTVYVTHTA